MKWTPNDITISPPTGYVADRQKQLEQRRTIIDDLFGNIEGRKTRIY